MVNLSRLRSVFHRIVRVSASENHSMASPSPVLPGPGGRRIPKKGKTRSLWDREFDIVEGGLEEGQVIEFVEDLLKRYNALVEEHKHRDTLRLLAETKVRKAEKLAASILQETRKKATKEDRQLSHGPTPEIGDRLSQEGYAKSDIKVNEPNHEASQYSQQTPGSEEAFISRKQSAEVTSHASDELATPVEKSSIEEARIPSDEGPPSTPSPYEVDIYLQPSSTTEEIPDMNGLLDYLEQSQEISVKDYGWAPSSGWAFTVSVHSTRPMISLLTDIPGVERAAEEEPPRKPHTPSSLRIEGGAESPQPSQTSRKRVRVWLKEGSD
ncbi:MAG: hypothetical protein ACE5JL_01850 [Dehalococcoidia bacterium]